MNTPECKSPENNCTILTNGFKIDGSIGTNISYYQDIQKIKGEINISDSDIQNFTFLKSLESISFSNKRDNEKVVINIRNNSKFNRLGFPKLKELKNTAEGYSIANLENNHPDFCLTLQEMIFFLQNQISFVNLHAKYCEGDYGKIEICHFQNLANLPENCTYIMGDLKIESGDEKYVKKLKNLEYLFGSLIIRKTEFKELKFLGKLKYIAVLEGCPAHKLNSTFLPLFKSCTFLDGGLNITSQSPLSDLSILSNIETIRGKIEISNQNFQNLSFLGNLKKISSEDWMEKGQLYINIRNNPEMRELGLEKLEELQPYRWITLNLESLHPDFCVTLQQMILMLAAPIYFEHFDAKFCDFNENDFSEKLCRFESWATLDSDCVYIYGHISVERGDEENAKKLGSVTHIFGSLSIKDTSLTYLSFLRNLEKMANLNESVPMIEVIDNKNLTEIGMSKLDTTIARGGLPKVVITSTADLFSNTYMCKEFESGTKTNVSYNGRDCDARSRRLGSVPRVSWLFLMSVLFFGFV
ncbi:hypothetical protein CAEBREN_04165 [Caenorhabditis brenneri]|uniref:Receptor L-domain domain-containing protein n=1 Tax=Caenorhabditis brenneri TaxID=135651 RepID=G0MMC7_CAEBE|nr:hypothetical protein CAEBREN_04165 [Caenorhabditis brenneri]